jgi:protein-tyrosine phosphatase
MRRCCWVSSDETLFSGVTALNSIVKYSFLFAVAGVLLVALAALKGGYFVLLLWPAVSCFAIALAYFYLGPRVFGKRPNGKLTKSSLLLLLPYHLYLWCVWHALRLVRREDCCNQLADDITIGRRPLPAELPGNVDVVVDLTCEFYEPRRIRKLCGYQSFPLLDGVAPTPQRLIDIVSRLSELPGHIYIHCAQGHGRTALVAAALLLVRGRAANPAEAIELMRSVRPLVRLSRGQRRCLDQAFALM